MGKPLVSHQKDRLDRGIQLVIRHHHREFASDVGQRPNATNHHFGSEASDEIDRQALEDCDSHIADFSCHRFQ